MNYLVLILLTLSFSVQAHELTYDSYLTLQKNLAKDDFEQAHKTWVKICEKEIGHYAKDYSYNDCSIKQKNIKQLRNSFKALSEIYIKNGETIKNGEIVIAKCPMANARWLQKKGTLQNPYYGEKMLQCGEFEK